MAENRGNNFEIKLDFPGREGKGKKKAKVEAKNPLYGDGGLNFPFCLLFFSQKRWLFFELETPFKDLDDNTRDVVRSILAPYSGKINGKDDEEKCSKDSRWNQVTLRYPQFPIHKKIKDALQNMTAYQRSLSNSTTPKKKTLPKVISPSLPQQPQG